MTGQQLTVDVSLESVAEAALADLRSRALEVSLVRREPYGSADDPGLLQLVSLVLEVEGTRLELQQLQVFVPAHNHGDGPVETILYLVSLTGLRDQVQDASGDFETFLRSITVSGGIPDNGSPEDSAGGSPASIEPMTLRSLSISCDRNRVDGSP